MIWNRAEKLISDTFLGMPSTDDAHAALQAALDNAEAALAKVTQAAQAALGTDMTEQVQRITEKATAAAGVAQSTATDAVANATVKITQGVADLKSAVLGATGKLTSSASDDVE